MSSLFVNCKRQLLIHYMPCQSCWLKFSTNTALKKIMVPQEDLVQKTFAISHLIYVLKDQTE
jgi:hypothetical protein